jgi:hypothetical protein
MPKPKSVSALLNLALQLTHLISILPLYGEFIRIKGGNARNRIAMVNLKRLPASILIFLALLAVFVGLGQAMITTLIVKGGEEVNYPINLVVEDRVLIQFNAIGEPASILQFSIIFPNGTAIDFGEVGKASYSFICDAEGEYTLHFVNNDQGIDKHLTLNYEIQHYVFGIPSMLFLALLIVLACVGGVFAFVILGRKS